MLWWKMFLSAWYRQYIVWYVLIYWSYSDHDHDLWNRPGMTRSGLILPRNTEFWTSWISHNHDICSLHCTVRQALWAVPFIMCILHERREGLLILRAATFPSETLDRKNIDTSGVYWICQQNDRNAAQAARHQQFPVSFLPHISALQESCVSYKQLFSTRTWWQMCSLIWDFIKLK